jgi:hypothetical protein
VHSPTAARAEGVERARVIPVASTATTWRGRSRGRRAARSLEIGPGGAIGIGIGMSMGMGMGMDILRMVVVMDRRESSSGEWD